MSILIAQSAIALLDADRAPGPVGKVGTTETCVDWCCVAIKLPDAAVVSRFALQMSESGMICSRLELDWRIGAICG